MTWDDVINRKEGSADVYHAETSYTYTALSTGGGVTAGAFLGGVSTYSETVNYKIGHLGGRDNSPHDTSITTTFQWWDGAVQSHITYDRNIYQGGTVLWTTDFAYDLGGKMTWADIDDGRDREVFFVNDANGQVMKRWEVSSLDDPIDNYFTFNGRRIGETSNNGATDRDYATMIAARDDDPPSGSTAAFRYGQVTPHADFDQSYNVINATTPGAQPSSYTVEQGDTLRSIAQAVWGDGALWYILAEANGLTAASELAAGITLVIPAHVANVHNTSETFRPYDPNKAMGNVSPTQPKPAKKPGGCGAGAIIVAVIAIVVTAIVAPQLIASTANFLSGATAGAPGFITAEIVTTAISHGTLLATVGLPAAVVGSAAAGAIGSIVSQGVGVATGLQDKFSWNAVGMAALGGAVGAGVPGIPGMDKAMAWAGKAGSVAGKYGSAFAAHAVRGAVSSVITQGIGVATGMQKAFDWAGVAVNAVSAGVAGAMGEAWGAPDNYAAGVVRNATLNFAGGAVGAATRSLVEGSDFGDNLLATLPDVIANTIGDMVLGRIEVGAGAGLEQKRQPEDDQQKWDNLGSPESAPADSASQIINLRGGSGRDLDYLFDVGAPPELISVSALPLDTTKKGTDVVVGGQTRRIFTEALPWLAQGTSTEFTVGELTAAVNGDYVDRGKDPEAWMVASIKHTGEGEISYHVQWADKDARGWLVLGVQRDGSVATTTYVPTPGKGVFKAATFELTIGEVSKEAVAAKYEAQVAERERYDRAMRISESYRIRGNPKAAAVWAHEAREGPGAAWAARISGIKKQLYNRGADLVEGGQRAVLSVGLGPLGQWVAPHVPIFEIQRQTILPHEQTGADTVTATEIAVSIVGPPGAAAARLSMAGNAGRAPLAFGRDLFAAERGAVTLYRVDDVAFAPRIAADGSIPVVTARAGGERALFVNIGQPERAAEFALVNRGGNATVTAVEVDASFLQRMRSTSVLDTGPEAALRPTAPLRVDVNKAPDQFGLRTPDQIQMLRDAIRPGTARVVDPRTLRR